MKQKISYLTRLFLLLFPIIQLCFTGYFSTQAVAAAEEPSFLAMLTSRIQTLNA
ncbi:MAG: hypothetical protein HQK53_17790, partial [Oligoflexia bacterium]|nr:hypothetical protein [Oligoflexia bacterium]